MGGYSGYSGYDGFGGYDGTAITTASAVEWTRVLGLLLRAAQITAARAGRPNPG
ncbi:hypothetical protein [Paenibacillus sp. FSL R7-0273]|uniref:hypothetical protein n=1 Tax=Paenibacillus sp. FSL R7-0273 TaxID=1536772 RepID=UPI000B0C8CF1|nr:hypothetical protein [Paenibacillus sp. FSL R7-0273]